MYESIKVFDKIGVVLRDKAGYFVDLGNENQIESAKRWAKNDEVVEVENHFDLEILREAGRSREGGKLSFWTVMVRNEDVEFSTAVNSESLCDLIKAKTFVKGKCEGVCLGWKNGQNWVFSDDDLEDAKRDAEVREKAKKKTTKYEVGDIVGGVRERYVYFGEMVQYRVRHWMGYTEIEPKMVHVYASLRGERIWFVEGREKKGSMTVWGHWGGCWEDVPEDYRGCFEK